MTVGEDFLTGLLDVLKILGYITAVGFLVFAVITLVAVLLWFVTFMWVGFKGGFNGKHYNTDRPSLILISVFLSTVEFFQSIPLVAMDIYLDVYSHFVSNFKVYLLLIFLSITSAFFMIYTQQTFGLIDTTYNKFFFPVFLGPIFFPIANSLRILLDVLVPFWNTVVNLSVFFTIKVLALGVICGVEEVESVALTLTEFFIAFVLALVNWFTNGALTSRYDLARPMEKFGVFVKSTGTFAECLCSDAAGLYNLIIFPLTDRDFHEGVSDLFNALLQLLVQQPGSSIKQKQRPDLQYFFNDTCNGIVKLGLTFDNFITKVYLDIMDLVDEPTNVTKLPPFSGIVTRPTCFVLKMTNITSRFLINIGRLNSSYADFSPAFKEVNETGNAFNNLVSVAREVFDTESVPALNNSIASVGTLLNQTVRLIGVSIKVPLDFIVITATDIAQQDNFFDSLHQYYDSGGLNPVFFAIESIGLSSANIIGVFFQPLQCFIISVFNLVSSVVQFVTMVIFHIDEAFEIQTGFWTSPATNTSINVVFNSVSDVGQCIADISSYIAVRVAVKEMENDTYWGNINNWPQDNTAAQCEIINILQVTISFTYYNYTLGQNVTQDSVGVTYWAQFFCCLSSLFEDSLNEVLIIIRDAVNAIQLSLPPTLDNLEAQFFNLEDLIEDTDAKLAVVIEDATCILSFFSLHGTGACPAITETNPWSNYCPNDILGLAPNTTVYTPQNERQRFQDFLNATVSIVRIPVQLTSAFFQLLDSQGAFINCSNLNFTSPSQALSGQRQSCAQAIVSEFVDEVIDVPIAIVVKLGLWLQCYESGLGSAFISVGCIGENILNELQAVFINAALLLIDFIGFITSGDLDSLVDAIIDAFDLVIAILKAIANIVWNNLIVPLLHPLEDVLYTICMAVQTTLKAVSFDIAPSLGCEDIYSSLNYDNSSSGAAGHIPLTPSPPIPLPTELPSFGPIKSEYFSNLFNVFSSSAPPSISNSPSSASISPSASLSISPSEGLPGFMRRDEGVNPVPIPGEKDRILMDEGEGSYDHKRRKSSPLKVPMHEHHSLKAEFRIIDDDDYGEELGSYDTMILEKEDEERVMYFNEANFPNLVYSVNYDNGTTAKEYPIGLLHTMDATIGFKQYYNKQKNQTRIVLDSIYNLTNSISNLFHKTLKVSRDIRFMDSVQETWSAAWRFSEKNSTKQFLRLMGRALASDRYEKDPWLRSNSSLFGILSQQDPVDVTPIYRRMEKLNKGIDLWFDRIAPKGEARDVIHEGIFVKRDVAGTFLNLLANCTLLDELVLTILQRACAIQRFFETGGYFGAEMAAFRAYFANPSAYNGTEMPESFLNSTCSYLNEFINETSGSSDDFSSPHYKHPRIPGVKEYDKPRVADYMERHKNSSKFSLTHELLHLLEKWNVTLAKDADKVADFLFNNSIETKGLMFYFENYIFCNYTLNLECRNPDGLGLKKTLIIYAEVAIVLTLFSLFVFTIPGYAMLIILLASIPVVFLVAYIYSPTCIPAIPICFFDNLFDLLVEIFPKCIDWPTCFVKSVTYPPPPKSNHTFVCPSYTFYDYETDLMIDDGLDNIAIYLEWAFPDLVPDLNETSNPLFHAFYTIPVVNERLNKFYDVFYNGTLPDQYKCASVVTAGNLALILLIAVPSIIIILSFVLFFSRTIVYYVYAVLPIMTYFNVILAGQVVDGFVEGND